MTVTADGRFLLNRHWDDAALDAAVDGSSANGSLAEAYEAAGRTKEALAAYRQAVVRNPGWREGRERIQVLNAEER